MGNSGEVLIPRGPWQVEHRLIAFSSPGVRGVASGAAVWALTIVMAPANANPRAAELKFVIDLLLCASFVRCRGVGHAREGRSRNPEGAAQKATQTLKNSVLLSLALRPLP